MKKSKEIIIIAEIFVSLVCFWGLAGLMLPGPMELTAHSEFAYYSVIVKLIRFGFLSVSSILILSHLDKYRRSI